MPDASLVGRTVAQLEVFFSSDYLWVVTLFVSSHGVNLIGLFLCDDALQQLGRLHASLTLHEDLVPVKYI